MTKVTPEEFVKGKKYLIIDRYVVYGDTKLTTKYGIGIYDKIYFNDKREKRKYAFVKYFQVVSPDDLTMTTTKVGDIHKEAVWERPDNEYYELSDAVYNEIIKKRDAVLKPITKATKAANAAYLNGR